MNPVCESVVRLTWHLNRATAIASIGSDKILVGSATGYISKWLYRKPSTLAHVNTYRADDIIKIMAIIPVTDEKFISINEVCQLIEWNIDGTIYRRMRFRGKVYDVNAVALLPNNLLVLAGKCKTVQECFDVWDLESGRLLYAGMFCQFRPNGMTLSITAEGFLAAAGYWSEKLTIWQIDRTECKMMNEIEKSRIYSMATLATGDILAGSHNFDFYGFSHDTGLTKYKEVDNGNIIDYIYPVDGDKVLIMDRSEGNSNVLKMWNFSTGECKRLAKIDSNHCRCIQNVVLKKQGTVISLAKDEIHIKHFPGDVLSFSKNLAEVRKSARVLSQAYRNGTSLFARLPKEISLKIAAMTSHYANEFQRRLSEKIAQNYFCKPMDCDRYSSRVVFVPVPEMTRIMNKMRRHY